MLLGKTVVLGVTGSIAAHKAPDLVWEMKKLGVNVYVVMTEAATRFITHLTMQTVSQNPVAVDRIDGSETIISHITLAEMADVLLVAPVTANTIGKIANGIADNVLTAAVLACRAPKLIAPAMNPKMYGNPILQRNIEKLKGFGYKFIEPEYGVAYCGTEGKGLLAGVGRIVNEVTKVLEKQAPTSKGVSRN